MAGMEKELESLENEYGGSEEEEENFCVACNKQLRNEKAYQSHLKQKKHLDNVAALKEMLKEDDSHGLNVDDLNLDTNSVGSENDAAASEGSEAEAVAQAEETSATTKKSKKQKKRQKQQQKVAAVANNESAAELDKESSGVNVTAVKEANDEEDTDFTTKPKSKKGRKNKTKKAPSETAAEKDDGIVVNDQAGKKGKKKGRRKRGIDDSDDEDEADLEERSKKCAVCGNTFDSKNKLFNHLKSTGHATYLGK